MQGFIGDYELYGTHPTLQGFLVGAMHCMGLTHTSSSLNRKGKSVGGGGGLECAVV